jgi:hypothetical protein
VALTAQWQADHEAFGERDLSESDHVYVWADDIHLRIRLAEAKSCVLVLMGVRADGTKELIAMAGGYRESADSWADLLRDCRRRGMRAPVLATASRRGRASYVGDHAIGVPDPGALAVALLFTAMAGIHEPTMAGRLPTPGSLTVHRPS